MKNLILLILISSIMNTVVSAEEELSKLDNKAVLDNVDIINDTLLSGSFLEIENKRKISVQILDIISITDDYSIKFYPVNSSIKDIILPKSVYVRIAPKKVIKCNIIWEDFSKIDTTSLGKKVLIGNIIPPDGYEFEGDTKPVVKMPFFIYEEGMEPLETAEIDSNHTDISYVWLMPLGGNILDYLDKENNYLFHTKDGDYFYCKVDWGKVGTADKQGKITVEGKYILPYGIKANDEKSKCRKQMFYVINTDDIYLEYVYMTAEFITTEWIKSITDFENIKPYYRKNNGKWIKANKEMYILNDVSFSVYKNKLEYDTEYDFKLNYNGKDYGNINIKVSKDEIKSEFIGGDKDGGDNKKQELPDYVYNGGGSPLRKEKDEQNSKIKDNKVYKSFNEPIIESETKNIDNEYSEKITPNKTITFGDKIIAAEKTQGDYVTFEKKGIALEVPSDFIKSNINESDCIDVEINREKENINIEFEINNKSVENIDGAKLRISEKTEEIKNESESIKDISNNDTYSEFPIKTLGTYTIDIKENKNKKDYKFLIVMVLIPIAGAVFIKWINIKK